MAALYGGQAVIEGVMMRGAQHFAVACRRASGEIAITCEPVPKIFRPQWQKAPFLRGVFSLADAMTLGTKALFWAAKQASDDISSVSGASGAAESSAGGEILPAIVSESEMKNALRTGNASSKSAGAADIAIGSALVFGLFFAVVLFKVLPQFAISLIQWKYNLPTYVMGILDVFVRLTIFMTYIMLISRMEHVHRVFQYHGAEHKAINALEAGAGLSVATARDASRFHPRCGTSFVFIVIILSVFAAAPFYSLPIWYRIPIGLALLFPVASIAFELLRLAGVYRNNPIAHLFSVPGMWAQRLTTREPDDSQLEVSIASLVAVMNAEKSDGNISAADEPEAAAVA
jgi:hypothetical protein